MSNGKVRLGVLFGGRSGEHEVSLMSARSLLSVLDTQKYDITQIGITHAGQWLTGENVLDRLTSGDTTGLLPCALIPEPGDNRLYVRRPAADGELLYPHATLDVIFPVMHGTGGEDGAIQGLLEIAGIAYVGAGVLASSVGMDKAVFKDVMRARGLPVVDSLVFTRREVRENLDKVIEDSEAMGDYPYFTKPVNLGSSVGISKCHNREELVAGLREAARYDRRVLVEVGINNPIEIEVSVLGNDNPQVSQPGEIRPAEEFYTYSAKYLSGKSELIIPAPLPDPVIRQIRRLASRAYRAIDCAGMARVDFLIEPEEFTIYLSEVNTIPGFTQISMYPKLWAASGRPYTDLIDRLIQLALERKAEQDQTERQFGRGQ